MSDYTVGRVTCNSGAQTYNMFAARILLLLLLLCDATENPCCWM